MVGGGTSENGSSNGNPSSEPPDDEVPFVKSRTRSISDATSDASSWVWYAR